MNPIVAQVSRIGGGLVIAGAAAACWPSDPTLEPLSTTTPNTSTLTLTSGLDATSTVTSTGTTADGDTTASSSPTSSDSSGDPPPLPGCENYTGGMGECDLWQQDCPEGEKCMPWANDGGNSWNAARCSPLHNNPGQPGDPCLVEGDGVSGIDDCDLGAMCWDVDPGTNQGTCFSLCIGCPDASTCQDPDQGCYIANNGFLPLCMPLCDPLLQDCVDGEGCYPVEDFFTCTPDASGRMGAAGDLCEFINVCDPGNACVSAELVPGCPGPGCCSPFCDTTSPMCPFMGQSCEPWYEDGESPAGYEHVGICAAIP